MKLIIFCIIIFFGQSSYCQYWGDSTLKSSIIFSSVEESPKFPGGNKGFYQFIAENLKKPKSNYSRFSNKVIMARIIIDKEGKVVFAEIEKGISEHLDQTVLELIKIMPHWTPGKQNGKNVLCYQTIPIVFVE